MFKKSRLSEKLVILLPEGKRMIEDCFVIASSSMIGLWEEVKKIALANSPILILGENGVGKSTLAYQIYKNCSRYDKSFVSINCTFFNEETFFADILNANDGILYLSEIDQLPLENQGKILQLIQDKIIQKDNQSEVIPLNVRVIASSSKNLEHLALYKEFNENLLFLLSSYTVTVPPLRERLEDIEVLSNYFLNKYQQEVKKKFEGFSESAKKMLHSCRWQGNVRELENVIHRSCIVATESLIQSRDLLLFDSNVICSKDFANEVVVDSVHFADKTLKTALDNFKYAYVKKILQECSWNQTKAAKVLDIQRTYISKLIKELRIRDDK